MDAIVTSKYAIGIYAEALILIILIIYLVSLLRKKKITKKYSQTIPYTVQRGETLKSIAKDRGISKRRLAKINKKDPSYTVIGGEEIRVPVISKSKGKKKKGS